MSFDALLLTCLRQGTHFQESGTSISVKPNPGETILFFAIDDQSNSDSTVRQDLSITGSLCDLVVFYATDNRVVVCLVELKGRDLKKAADQIINTFTALRQSLERSVQARICRRSFQRIEWKAFIHQHGASPNNQDRAVVKNLMTDHFGKRHFTVVHAKDLGQFLRR